MYRDKRPLRRYFVFALRIIGYNCSKSKMTSLSKESSTEIWKKYILFVPRQWFWANYIVPPRGSLFFPSSSPKKYSVCSHLIALSKPDVFMTSSSIFWHFDKVKFIKLFIVILVYAFFLHFGKRTTYSFNFYIS